MSFVIKVRSSGGPMVAEYLCPLHGRFEVVVQRDANGDPPATHACPAIDSMLGASVDYTHAQAPAGPTEAPCPIDDAEWVISAPLGKVALASATQGKVERPENPLFYDTRALGEGMPLNEWKAQRDKLRKEQRRKQIREMLK